MTLLIHTQRKSLHLLSIPARVLAAYIKRSESGCVPVNKKALMERLGLRKDELNIAIGELRLQGYLTRYRHPETRKQAFILHPYVMQSNNQYVGKSLFRWASFSGVLREKDYKAYVISLTKIRDDNLK